MNSVLNVPVSCFANYKTPDNPEDVNLLSWLQSDKYKNEVLRIREIEDKAERDKLKAKLPCITPSGLFSYRNKKSLIKHSGIICLDIDGKENEHIKDFAELRNQLSNIENIAYCGLSVSAQGVFCLIPVAYPEKHLEHILLLQEKFLLKGIKIKIDESCKDVSRLRGYSFDPEGFFRHEAKVFREYKDPAPITIQKQHIFKKGKTSRDKIAVAVRMIYNAPENEKHYTLLKASTLIGGYIANGEVDEATAIEQMEVAIQSKPLKSFADAQKTIRKGILHGKTIPIRR